MSNRGSHARNAGAGSPARIVDPQDLHDEEAVRRWVNELGSQDTERLNREILQAPEPRWLASNVDDAQRRSRDLLLRARRNEWVSYESNSSIFIPERDGDEPISVRQPVATTQPIGPGQRYRMMREAELANASAPVQPDWTGAATDDRVSYDQQPRRPFNSTNTWNVEWNTYVLEQLDRKLVFGVVIENDTGERQQITRQEVVEYLTKKSYYMSEVLEILAPSRLEKQRQRHLLSAVQNSKILTATNDSLVKH